VLLLLLFGHITDGLRFFWLLSSSIRHLMLIFRARFRLLALTFLLLCSLFRLLSAHYIVNGVLSHLCKSVKLLCSALSLHPINVVEGVLLSSAWNVDTLEDSVFLLFVSGLLLILLIIVLNALELVIEVVLRILNAEICGEFIRVLD
jgi:hypothetical protein